MKVGIKDKGFVDVFKKVYFIIEYKWFGSDFGVVFQQVIFYFCDLGNLLLFLIFDFQCIEINMVFMGISFKSYLIIFDDIVENWVVGGNDVLVFQIFYLVLYQLYDFDLCFFWERIMMDVIWQVGFVVW